MRSAKLSWGFDNFINCSNFFHYLVYPKDFARENDSILNSKLGSIQVYVTVTADTGWGGEVLIKCLHWEVAVLESLKASKLYQYQNSKDRH